MIGPINSLSWWNSYFQNQWEANNGRNQTRYFISRLVDHIAAHEAIWLAAAGRSILDWGRWYWWQALKRRSQRGRLTVTRLNRLISHWLPSPRVLHPYPMIRFAATQPR
jgi:RNA-directed DNA polymerase